VALAITLFTDPACPFATAEVAAIAQLDFTQARAALSRVAEPIAAGADFYGRLKR
jgi:hypothetical protein